MDRWIDGRIDGSMDGRMDGWTDGRTDRQTDRQIDNFYSNTTQHTNQTMPISTKSLSSVGIKRAIQKGQEFRCCWITISNKKPSAVSLPRFHDNSSTDISSTTVYQRVGQLYMYIQLLFQQIIIFINSNFYLHYDSLYQSHFH